MHRSKLAFLLAILPLAGCETLGLSSSAPPAYPDETGAATAIAAPSPTLVAEPCPLSAVLSETSKMVVLRGSGQAATDVALTAEISPPRLECDYDPSTRVDNIDMNFPLILTKGPAANGDQTQITYFIALVNMAGEVIAKRAYQRQVNFEGKQSFIATESVQNLVLTLGPGTVPTDHRILIGFQLTPAQLAYNRARTALPPTPAPATAAAPAPAPTVTPAASTRRGRHAKPVAATTASATQPSTARPAPAAAATPSPAQTAAAPGSTAATATGATTSATPTPGAASDAVSAGTTPAAATASAPASAPVTADSGVTRATLPSPYPDDEPDAPAAATADTPAAAPASPADQPAAAPAPAPAATPTTTPPAGQ